MVIQAIETEDAPELAKYLGDGYNTLTNSLVGIAITNIDAQKEPGSFGINTFYQMIETREDIQSLSTKAIDGSASASTMGITATASFQSKLENSVSYGSLKLSIVLVVIFDGVHAVLNGGQFNPNATSYLNQRLSSSFLSAYGNAYVKKVYLGGILIATYTYEITSSSNVSRSDLVMALNLKAASLSAEGSLTAEQSESMSRVLSQTMRTGTCFCTDLELDGTDVIDTQDALDAKKNQFLSYYKAVLNGSKSGELAVFARELYPYWTVPGSGYDDGRHNSLFPTYWDPSKFKVDNLKAVRVGADKYRIDLRWDNICNYADFQKIYYQTPDMPKKSEVMKVGRTTNTFPYWVPSNLWGKSFKMMVVPLKNGIEGQSMSIDVDPCRGSILGSGLDLKPLEFLRSPNGNYQAICQGDGNFVVYDKISNRAVWNSHTSGKTVGSTIMQSDGNFVIYGTDKSVYFHTGTYRSLGAYMVIQDDGSLVIYDTIGIPQWSTGPQVITMACASVTSEPHPQSGQSHRSSGNFSTEGGGGTMLRWRCPSGITFDVKEDKSWQTDPIIFSRVTNGSVTGMYHSRSLYIADPTGATSNFTVSADGIAQ